MNEIVEHILDVLPAFALACLAVAVLPGPATALYLQRSVRDGRRAGLAAVVGNQIGVFGWALAAGAGLTALLQANTILFDVLHIVGAVVLVCLGVSAWRNARHEAGEFGAGLIGKLPSGHTPGAAFRASLISIAANPKAAVFAFSFFPQFLPSHGPVLATAAALGVIQVSIDGAYCVGLVLLATYVRPWLGRAAVRRRLERTLGTILIALGIQLAFDAR